MKIKTSLIAGSALLLSASYANAALEEIVVTATKRAETIQDVPVSVAAVSADTMDKMGISDMEDLSMVVPNFEIQSASVIPNLYIRGLGGGLTHAIEQSVGRFVDDVYIGRGALNLHPFMDVASVEVLRGPQGTLFGKNTAAGALIIRTNDPTEEFEAGVNLSYGQYQTTGGVTEFNGFISGGLTDNVSGRVAFLYKDREGFYENQAEGPDGAQREDTGIQAKLKIDVSDATTVGLKLNYMEYDEHGSDVGEMTATGGPPLGYWQSLSANSGVASVFTPGLDWKIWNNCADAMSTPASGPVPIGAFCPGRDMETTTFLVDVDHEVEGGSIKFIAAYQDYDYVHRFNGADGGFANLFRATRSEQYDGFSTELRFTSAESDSFDYIAGLYFEESDLARQQDSDLNLNGVGPNTAFIGKHEPWSQSTETTALFAQGRWYLNDKVTGILGARWSDETKDFSFEEYMTPYGESAPIVMQKIELREESRSESKFTPSATLQVDVNDQVNVFASYSVGHKTGGFSDRVETQDGSIQYDAEVIDGIELGMKGLFLEDALSLNVTFYHMSIEGLQLSTQVPSAGGEPLFKVGNAADVTSKGIEVESNWAVNDSWTVGANYAYTDATYDDYVGSGDCSPTYLNADGVCDMSGATLQYAPENKASAYAEYFADAAVNGWDLNARLDLSYTGDHYTDVGLWDFAFTEAHTVYGASVRLISPDEKVTVSLIGRNLGNEKINAWTAPSGPNTISAMSAPRHITMKVGWSF